MIGGNDVRYVREMGWRDRLGLGRKEWKNGGWLWGKIWMGIDFLIVLEWSCYLIKFYLNFVFNSELKEENSWEDENFEVDRKGIDIMWGRVRKRWK
jgi:hypothetical protein